MLAQSYSPIVGGVERAVEELSTELARRGHEVGVATLRQPNGEPLETGNGVKVHPLGSSIHRAPGIRFDEERRHAPPVPDPETVLALRRLVRRERPEVVHAHNWIVNSYLPLARRSGAALVLSLHDYGLRCATKRFLYRGTLCEGPGPVKCVRCASDYYGWAKGPAVAVGTLASQPFVRRGVDVFLPVSEAVRDLSGIGPGEVSQVVPNFIGELPPVPPAGDQLLVRIPEEPFVLYFGDVTLDKGAGCLIDAYRGLKDAPPLVLIGRNFLPETDLPGVIALGPLPYAHAIEAVRRSLFTVVPSILPETFGLAALETAAAGKPIVASDIGGLPDIVVDGETDLLVPPGDREALESALRRLLDDETLRARLGESAALRAKEFGPDEVVPRVEEAYRTALEVRRARRRSAR